MNKNNKGPSVFTRQLIESGNIMVDDAIKKLAPSSEPLQDSHTDISKVRSYPKDFFTNPENIRKAAENANEMQAETYGGILEVQDKGTTKQALETLSGIQASQESWKEGAEFLQAMIDTKTKVPQEEVGEEWQLVEPYASILGVIFDIQAKQTGSIAALKLIKKYVESSFQQEMSVLLERIEGKEKEPWQNAEDKDKEYRDGWDIGYNTALSEVSQIIRDISNQE